MQVYSLVPRPHPTIESLGGVWIHKAIHVCRRVHGYGHTFFMLPPSVSLSVSLFLSLAHTKKLTHAHALSRFLSVYYQKRVVDLVKKNKSAVTLAIGDGANDVGMIKGKVHVHLQHVTNYMYTVSPLKCYLLKFITFFSLSLSLYL